jgi:succinate dehydrogenase/fumarate reductase flavoprotein subunit
MGIASGAELRHFLAALHAPRSFVYVARRVLAHLRDRLLHGRGMRLVNGHALAAALAASAFEAGVQLRLSTRACALRHEGGRIAGATVEGPDGQRYDIHAARGVVLAGGGVPHDATRKRALLPHAPTGQEHWSAASRGATGDGLALGEQAGGRVRGHAEHGAALAPVSLVPQRDGSVVHFPHLVERGKPGVIAVTAEGLRFTNEADSYYDFLRDLIGATPAGRPVEAWLVCDHAFIRRYGLGAVKPAPMPMGRHLASGYLRRADSLAALARDCGIDAAPLESTVARYNALARAGRDEDFAKGETPYNRMQGDASRGFANPCMAPLVRAPFYAVRLVPGSLGTFAGLACDANARVLDDAGRPIAGLYAAGADMASVMEGFYPSGGITLGPALTFGFLAAEHAAAHPPASS